MLRKLLLGIAVLAASGNSISQISSFGIQPKVHFNRQIYQPKLTIQHVGLSAESFLTTFGADLFMDVELSKRFRIRIKAGYESKGFSTHYSSGHASSPNKFHYLAGDVNLNFNLLPDNAIQPYLFLGISSGYLVKSSISSDTTILRLNHHNVGYDKYRDLQLSASAGFGIDFNEVLYLEFEFNRDILYPINEPALNLWNVSYSINAGLHIPGLINAIKGEKPR